jgi:hypothetical protein
MPVHNSPVLGMEEVSMNVESRIMSAAAAPAGRQEKEGRKEGRNQPHPSRKTIPFQNLQQCKIIFYQTP